MPRQRAVWVEARTEKPRPRDLARIYEDLVTTDPGQRVAAYARAMQWYDQAVQYVQYRMGGTLNMGQLKDLDVGSKCRLLGIRSRNNGEKENAFHKAILRFERLCQLVLDGAPVVPKLPLIEDVLQNLEQQQSRLGAEQERLTGRYGALMQLLQRALQPVNPEGQPVELHVGVVNMPYRIDPEGTRVTFSRKLAKELRSKHHSEGLYSVVLDVLKPLTQAGALEPETDGTGGNTGKYIVTVQKQLPVMHQLLTNFKQFAMTAAAPRTLVRRLSLRVATSGMPRPRPSGFGPNQERVDGLFVAGSMREKIYSFLKDGAWHEVSQLTAMVKKPEDVKYFVGLLKAKGLPIEYKNGKYRMKGGHSGQPTA